MWFRVRSGKSQTLADAALQLDPKRFEYALNMRATVAAIVTVSIMTIAGCGHSERSASAIVSAAQSKTEAAKTARVSFKVSAQGQTVETNGIADLTSNDATFSMKLAGVGTIQAIQDGSTLYEKLRFGTARISKPWIKFDIAAGMHNLTGVDAQYFAQNMSTEPAAVLDYLRGVSRDIHEVGSETLRGVATTQYRGTVDLTLASSGSTNATRKQGLQQLMKLLGVSTFPVDVWIDNDGRLRQLRYSLDMAKFKTSTSTGTKLSGTASYAFEFYDFGVAFSKPALPKPEQVQDITAELGQPTAPVTPTPASSGQPIASTLVPTAPGFSESMASDVTNGPIDAASFEMRIGSKAAADQLKFTAGFEETFDAATNSDYYQVTLMQFATPAAAAQFELATVTAISSDGKSSRPDTRFPTGWILDSKKATTDGWYDHFIVARKQNRAMVMYCGSKSARVAPQLLATLAQQQYARL
jgi:hypothetical protein